MITQLSSSAHQDENACVRTPSAQLFTWLSNSNKCNFQAFPESGVFPSWHFLPSRLRNESSRSLPYSGRGCRKFPDFVCVYLLGGLGKKIPQADFWIRRFTSRGLLWRFCVWESVTFFVARTKYELFAYSLSNFISQRKQGWWTSETFH